VPTTDGTAIAVTVTPTSIPLRTDVANPGADWVFSPATRSYFPGWPNAWVYTPGGTAYGCVRVEVRTYLAAWILRVAATVTPAQPLDVALFRPGMGVADMATCVEPGPATSPAMSLRLSSTPMEVVRSGGSRTMFVGLGVHASGPVAGNPIITLNWTAGAGP
jgi:hypothetical protein